MDGRGRAAWDLSEYRLMPYAQILINEIALTGKYMLFVVTNQPDVSKGLLSLQKMKEINNQLIKDLPEITTIATCVHDYEDRCYCRKPKPGLIIELAREYNVSLRSSWMIGDRWVDIEAGTLAGCRTVLLEGSNSWKESGRKLPDPHLRPTLSVKSLQEILPLIQLDV